jgi:hypothetical protein
MVTDDEAVAIKTRVAPQLLALPGVTAVGLGSKEVAGQPTGELALKVFVVRKRPPDELDAADLIPAEIDGLRTDVIEGGEIRLVVDPPGAVILNDNTDDTRSRPLVGGRRIRREGSGYAGTVGCFLVDAAHVGTAYGLTNYHVVDVPDVSPLAAGTSAVGQPTGDSSMTACCNDLFGKYAGGERVVPGADEAVIKLDPGMQWQAEIAEIGIVTDKHEITQAEATPQTYKVRKRGARTGLTGGVVRSLNTSSGHADNGIVIQPNANPTAGTRTVFFDYEGDSGSALVNDASEVVGLIYARDDSGNGYAYAIDHVLERLGKALSVTLQVAVATAPGVVNTVPGAAMVATPPELVAELGAVTRPVPVRVDAPATMPGFAFPPIVAPAFLQSDLDRSSTGRLLIVTWLTHQRELLSLINANRRVAVAWHRTGLSALVQVLMRMPNEHELPLPETIHGQPVRGVLTRMRATLERFASPALSADLARLDKTLPDLGGLTYPQIIAALGTD